MKLLSISDNVGHFLGADGTFKPIDLISKEDLLRLVRLSLEEETLEMDEYDDEKLKNQAHQIIYKSVYQKLLGLRGRRKEFVDESARMFLEEYEKYRDA